MTGKSVAKIGLVKSNYSRDLRQREGSIFKNVLNPITNKIWKLQNTCRNKIYSDPELDLLGNNKTRCQWNTPYSTWNCRSRNSISTYMWESKVVQRLDQIRVYIYNKEKRQKRMLKLVALYSLVYDCHLSIN